MKTAAGGWPGFLPASSASLAPTVAAVHAQRIWAGFYGRTPPKFPTATTFDGSFHFCRVMFTSDRREKQGWGTDYPGADINLSVRLAELTKVRVTMTHDGEEAGPRRRRRQVDRRRAVSMPVYRHGRCRDGAFQ